jgi:hypothetical protein
MTAPVVPPPPRSADIHVDLGPPPAPSPITEFTFDDDPFSITWSFADESLSFGDFSLG